jgi:uracil-DNA glycosylase
VGNAFCPGYSADPFAGLVRDCPGEEVFRPAHFRTEWGPIFHRGRLDGSARVLVLGQDPAAHETIARRILVGEAGQRVQGLLAKIGITTSYVMVNTFVYSVYGQGSGTKHAKDPDIARYRNRWLDALLVGTGVTAVVTLGGLAKTAYGLWAPTQPSTAAGLHHAALKHPTYPESASHSGAITLAAATSALHADWNAHLAGLSEHVAPEAAVDLRPYAGQWQPGDRAQIPAADLPAGAPDWWQSLEAWADRTGADATTKRATIAVTVPPSARTWLTD